MAPAGTYTQVQRPEGGHGRGMHDHGVVCVHRAHGGPAQIAFRERRGARSLRGAHPRPDPGNEPPSIEAGCELRQVGRGWGRAWWDVWGECAPGGEVNGDERCGLRGEQGVLGDVGAHGQIGQILQSGDRDRRVRFAGVACEGKVRSLGGPHADAPRRCGVDADDGGGHAQHGPPSLRRLRCVVGRQDVCAAFHGGPLNASATSVRTFQSHMPSSAVPCTRTEDTRVGGVDAQEHSRPLQGPHRGEGQPRKGVPIGDAGGRPLHVQAVLGRDRRLQKRRGHREGRMPSVHVRDLGVGTARLVVESVSPLVRARTRAGRQARRTDLVAGRVRAPVARQPRSVHRGVCNERARPVDVQPS